MKAYQNKKIPKYEIQRILRTLDPTKIFRLYKSIYGGAIKRVKLYDFIREYAPTRKVYMASCDIAFNRKHTEESIALERAIIRKHGLFNLNRGFRRKIVVDEMKKQICDPCSNYAKRPMYSLDRKYLSFCSPVYRHSDYNRWECAIEVDGNERFCELVIRYADRYFAPIYDYTTDSGQTSDECV